MELLLESFGVGGGFVLLSCPDVLSDGMVLPKVKKAWLLVTDVSFPNKYTADTFCPYSGSIIHPDFVRSVGNFWPSLISLGAKSPPWFVIEILSFDIAVTSKIEFNGKNPTSK